MPLDDDRRSRGRRAVCLALGAALVAAVPETGAAQAELVNAGPAETPWEAQAQAAPQVLATPAQGPQPAGPRRPAQRPYAKPEPAYAPWGRMAMRIVQNRYPNAAIVDYLHVGRRNLSATQAQETFKLWLRQGKQEFGVYVTITFNPKTQRVLRTDLRRTAR